MRTLIKTGIVLFLGTVSFLGCEENELMVAEKPNQQLVSEARAFFNTNIATCAVGLSALKHSKAKQPPIVQWEKASVSKLKSREVVIVPLSFEGSPSLKSSLAGQSFALNEITKLLMYRDGDSYRHEVITMLPDGNATKTSDSFNGVISIEDWAGNSIEKYHYRDGDVRNMKIATSDMDNVAGRMVILQVCTEYSGYNSSGGETYYWSYYSCNTYVFDDGVNSYDSFLPPSDYDGVGGGGGGGSGNGDSEPPPPPPTDMVDSVEVTLTNPCLVAAYTGLSNGNFTNKITSILRNTFGQSELLDITINEVTNLPNNVAAKTYASRSNGFVNITLSLNRNTLPYASKEYVTETILHELVHAYLNAINPGMTELNQHLAMAESYVDQIRDALLEIFPSLDPFFAMGIVLGGFGALQDDDLATFNSLLSRYNMTANLAQEINNEFKNGLAGSPCQ